MYFTETKALRELEILMQMIPGFSPKGYGSMVMPGQIYICLQEPPPPTYQEMIVDTMHSIRYRPFLQRVEQLLIESEMRPMNYQSIRHQRLFAEAIQKKDKKNYALLSALYLFTADLTLWRIMKYQIEGNLVRFDRRKLGGLNENSYTLYCAAKDLYMGTRHLTIRDLADRELISPKQFHVICNAMAIRRFGLRAVKPAERKNRMEEHEHEH